MCEKKQCARCKREDELDEFLATVFLGAVGILFGAMALFVIGAVVLMVIESLK
jgi:hypothetical protein